MHSWIQMVHFQTINMLSESFIPLSIASALLNVYSIFNMALSNENIALGLLDLSAAFGTIDNDVLLMTCRFVFAALKYFQLAQMNCVD